MLSETQKRERAQCSAAAAFMTLSDSLRLSQLVKSAVGRGSGLLTVTRAACDHHWGIHHWDAAAAAATAHLVDNGSPKDSRLLSERTGL